MSADDRIDVEVDASCLEVVEGLARGDRLAWAAAYRRYMDQLVQRAERLIPGRLRGKVVAESVVHSVMESLLVMEAAHPGRLSSYRIENWSQLYGLLARMTFHKCLNRVRSLDAAKRAADVAAPLDPAAMAAAGPSPEDEAAYAELVSRLLDRFQPAEMDVLQMRMGGYPLERIAAELGLTVVTVRSTVRRLQRRLAKLLAEGVGGG